MLLTDERQDALLGRPDGNKDSTFLSLNLHRIFLKLLK
jgi:hypothetical protein